MHSSYKYSILFLVCFLACAKEEPITLEETLGEIPMHFPEIEYPEDNNFSLERWQLGKRLFYDPILSIDNSISCASCHRPDLAFADDKTKSIGANNLIGRRNAPSLANVAFHPYYTREGGISTLEMQVLIPIQEHDEFNHNIVAIAEELNKDSTYVKESLEAYGRLPDSYVITRALANFERSLISGKSPYDLYLTQGFFPGFGNEEKQGMELFFSEKLACGSCHSGFDFTNYGLLNNGLYTEYEDEGRFRLTGNPEDKGVFKVPTLRNIGLSAPYMHDGSMETLTEVIDHYSQGANGHINQDPRIQGFEISETEKKNLILFLHSLTDHHFTSNPLFKE